MEQLHQEQAASDFFIFEELLADYIRLLGAVRVSSCSGDPRQRNKQQINHRWFLCSCIWEHWLPAGVWLLTGLPGVAVVLRDVWTSASEHGSDGRRLRARCRRRGRLRPSCCGPTSRTNSSRPKRRSLRSHRAWRLRAILERSFHANLGSGFLKVWISSTHFVLFFCKSVGK